MSYGIFNKISDVYVDGQRAVNNNSYYSAIIVINKQMPFDAFKLCVVFFLSVIERVRSSAN